MVPRAAWYFMAGTGLPGRGGGEFPWPVCRLAERQWSPPKERGWCGNESAVCGIEPVIEHLYPEVAARLPPRPFVNDELGYPTAPKVDWASAETRGLVRCGQAPTTNDETKRALVLSACWMRGSLHEEHRFGYEPVRFARLAQRVGGSGWQDWDGFVRWSLAVLVWRTTVWTGEHEAFLEPRLDGRIAAGLTVLERERAELEIANDPALCKAELEKAEGLIEGLDTEGDRHEGDQDAGLLRD